MKRLTLALGLLTFAVAPAQIRAPWNATTKDLVARISAQSMKGNLSFLSSDLLEGRGTPSRGLDLAAEFIAAEFRRDGLEAVGDDGYFQTTERKDRDGNMQKVRNVIGVLRGSDPKLKNTYVMVTAHYDHLGMKRSGEGDRIYNGADDDGSGVVSVLELAEAFSEMKVRPKRSIVFMTFYGEELGLVGSRFYGAHPVVPIKDTVADVNLEQVGRTDDTEGPRVMAAAMTGFGYSEVSDVFVEAGKRVGIRVTGHPRYSDAYFARSDNQALADVGVPAHTLCTAFEFPDYHRVSDTWDKVDYANMACVDRMVALGLYALADSTAAPRWSATNPKAAKYLKAWMEMHGGREPGTERSGGTSSLER